MFQHNHVFPGHSPTARPLLLVGLVVIVAVHLLAVGAVGHLTARGGPLSLANTFAVVLIGSIVAIVLFKLSHLLLFSNAVSKRNHGPTFKPREEKSSAH